ncbi:MAG: glycosyltransferase family 2 protein [Candidatus Limnocylindrales bacterium]
MSVVIPTHARPALLMRAVLSALAQTVPEVEVIVVVDGSDPATHEALAGLADPRLRAIELPTNGGACVARNRGVVEARADWIAFLDDDDEWLPTKLEVQLPLALGSRFSEPVVSCRVRLGTEGHEYVLPRRLPAADERIADYMFIRHGLLHGEGFIQTSTILASRRLLLRVPFDEALSGWHETDWLIRALALDGAGLEMAPQVLSSWDSAGDRPRISASIDWRDAFALLRARRTLLSRRAYAAALLSVIGDVAAAEHDPRAFAAIWREAVRNGSPTLLDHLTYLRIWLVPRPVRRGLAAMFLGRASRRFANR